MIRRFVSGLVIAGSALAVLAATLNTIVYSFEAQTAVVGGAYALFLALGVWSARGSHAGTLVLAACLVASGATLLLIAVHDAAPGTGTLTTSAHSPSRWRVPLVLSVLGVALLYDRWFAHSRGAGPQNNEMQQTSHG